MTRRGLLTAFLALPLVRKVPDRFLPRFVKYNRMPPISLEPIGTVDTRTDTYIVREEWTYSEGIWEGNRND